MQCDKNSHLSGTLSKIILEHLSSEIQNDVFSLITGLKTDVYN